MEIEADRVTVLDEQALIERWIEPNPHYPGRAEAWIKDYAIPVWALIGDLPVVKYEPEGLANAFGIPLDAVLAALAYHRQYRPLIDARILANSRALT